ncbi:MAG: ATP-binding cassette domain-containing protein [Orrella sp.]
MTSKNESSADHDLSELFAGTKITIILASCGINLLALALPLLMLQLYDRILPFQSLDTLTLLAATVLLAVLIESFLRAVRAYITSWVAARFEHRAMNAAVNRTLAEPLHQFEKKGTGLFMDRFRSITTLKYHYSGQSFQQLLDLPFTFLYIAVAFLISPWIGLLLICGYTVFALITLFRGRGFTDLVKEQKEVDARRGNFLTETVTNIHTLKSMTLESLMQRRHERLQESCARLMSRLAYRLDMASGIGAIFSPLMTMLTVAIGAWLVIQGQLTNGELAACVLLGMRALSPLQKLGGLWSKHQEDSMLRTELSKIMAEKTLPDSGRGAKAKGFDSKCVPGERPRQAATLELKQVSYQFPAASSPIFDHLDVKVEAGECLCITGEGGSGFSTLLQLMAGVLTPTGGQVMLDGEPLSKINDGEMNEQRVAYLPQTAQMFEGSIVENISLFDPSRIDTAIQTAKDIGLSDFVSRLPRGWDSTVGDMAVDSLSPGYRQRLAIVRALSNRPDVILFDDATSSVDAQGDRLFLEYLSSMRGKATIVIVSPRQSFQRLATRSLHLENGQLFEVEPGTTFLKTERPIAVNPATAVVTQQPMPSSFLEKKPVTDQVEGSLRWKHTYETVVNQFKATSDLASCLTILLELLNVRNSTREVAEALPYYTESLDLAGFHNTMAQLGYRMTVVSGPLGALDARALPSLFVPDKGVAFIVMGRLGNQMRVKTDSASESSQEVNLALQGRAFFYEQAKTAEVDTRGWVRRILSRFKPLIAQASVASLVSGALMVASPLFLIVVYATVIPSGATDTLLYLSIGAAAAIVSGFFFVRHRARILAYIAGRVEYLFGATIFQQILSMSPSYTERASVGSQSARIRSFESIRDMFTGPLASTLLELPATFVLLVALSLINPVALFVFGGVVLIYLILYRAFANQTRQRVGKVSDATMVRDQFLVEMISKMRTIRECKAQRVWLDRFRDVSADATMASYQAEQLAATILNTSYFVMMLAALSITTVSVPAVWSEALTPGALIASLILMWRVLNPIQTVFTNLTRLERVVAAAKQIDGLMKIQGERPNAVPVTSNRLVEGSIEFARVSLRYSLSADPALIGVEFRVKAGEIVAISGPNGGGKSTLLKLILGMYQPQAGAILIDNIDLRQLDPLELRRLVAYAPQEVQLFRATIEQNLKLARSDATDEEVMAALALAGAVEQVQALPKGLQYRVGDNTNQLSSNLLQKLSLARAYLTQSPILLLDEPGSGLDSIGDQHFMRAIQLLKGKRTVIFITHRPNYMRLADTLMVFERGYLRASGTPDKLLKQVAAA